eukprot:scaffold79971_cov19-Tisochrysis_lutea.AAC.1
METTVQLKLASAPLAACTHTCGAYFPVHMGEPVKLTAGQELAVLGGHPEEVYHVEALQRLGYRSKYYESIDRVQQVARKSLE